ncbi:CoA protein activase [Desulfitibacter alkalitolerans]|uniref:CoA protein activase n=1 Tax=Desulfitibacter alkalitolerans TaxID=264641 RepID=UPI0004840E62|nr:CoA protein activase [Desulfitibacter alkalitolerans]
MKVTFPHMGHFHVTGKTIFEGFGLDVVVPPPCSKKTLNIGTKYSPESACLPLKINLGNYIEAAELGADTIIMGGGVGPCRFGYYAEIQREILEDLGYNLEMVVLEPPDVHLSEVWDKVKYLKRSTWSQSLKSIHLAWHKTYAIDQLEMELHRLRPREINSGDADNIFKHFLIEIELCSTKAQVKKTAGYYKGELSGIPLCKGKPVVKIAIVGEIYTVLEPFVNFDMEKILGRLGVEVYRPLFLSQWINDHLLGGLLPIKGAKKAKKLASPYLNYFVGGHGRETVGHAVELKDKVDGVIQIAPLTCMPEIVAQTLLFKVSEDSGLPIMTIYVDEQTGKAGLTTSLEAFTDMIYRNKLLGKKEEAVTCMGI